MYIEFKREDSGDFSLCIPFLFCVCALPGLSSASVLQESGDYSIRNHAELSVVEKTLQKKGGKDTILPDTRAGRVCSAGIACDPTLPFLQGDGKHEKCHLG